MKSVSTEINAGNLLFEWEAPDYIRYNRGWLWYFVFCLVLFGSGAFFVITDPKWGWLPGLVFFSVAALYFWKHLDQNRTHIIRVFEHVVFIDKTPIPSEKIEGFWFVSDPTVSIINLEISGKKGFKISLQMGGKSQEFFRKGFEEAKIKELKDKKESLLDIWVRALKL